MEDLIISKELFEAVTKIRVVQPNSIEEKDFEVKLGAIFYYQQNESGSKYTCTKSINDFFFECKEWAFSKYYQINSGQRFVAHNNNFIEPKDEYYADIISSSDFWSNMIDNEDYKELFFISNSEQQSVFDACEHIRTELLK